MAHRDYLGFDADDYDAPGWFDQKDFFADRDESEAGLHWHLPSDAEMDRWTPKPAPQPAPLAA